MNVTSVFTASFHIIFSNNKSLHAKWFNVDGARPVMALKCYQEAAAHHKHTLQHDADDILIYESIAEVCRTQGLTSQALGYLKQAAQLCLKNRQIEKARQILNEMQVIEGGECLVENLEAELNKFKDPH